MTECGRYMVKGLLNFGTAGMYAAILHVVENSDFPHQPRYSKLTRRLFHHNNTCVFQGLKLAIVTLSQKIPCMLDR